MVVTRGQKRLRYQNLLYQYAVEQRCITKKTEVTLTYSITRTFVCVLRAYCTFVCACGVYRTVPYSYIQGTATTYSNPSPITYKNGYKGDTHWLGLGSRMGGRANITPIL